MKYLCALASIWFGVFCGGGAYADPDPAERVQAALETWLAQRAPVEKVTGIATYISMGNPGPAIEAFAGKMGRGRDDKPVDQNTLFHMGSTSKSFAAAVILKLEAAGALSLDDTIGKWLPEYPAWKDVSLRRLLNMTSGIPNYSETETLSRIWVEEPDRNLSAEELIAAAYPTGANQLPAANRYIRRLLYLGAMAQIMVKRRGHRLGSDWLSRMLTRKKTKVVAIALAHRMASMRICIPSCRRVWGVIDQYSLARQE